MRRLLVASAFLVGFLVGPGLSRQQDAHAVVGAALLARDACIMACLVGFNVECNKAPQKPNTSRGVPQGQFLTPGGRR